MQHVHEECPSSARTSPSTRAVRSGHAAARGLAPGILCLVALPDLDVAERRVLGALIEKQRTVPASYPLSLSALRTACNQSSSRDPVLDLDEQVVAATARGLKSRDLLRVVWSESGRRTLKHHQLLTERLDLAPDEAAVVAVLLLRGPQTAGELRARTERQHAFPDRAAVEDTLTRLSGREEPLVRELARRPGQHDPRWCDLLGGPDEDPVPASEVLAAEGEGVLRGGSGARDDRVRRSYDLVAPAYAAALTGELDDQPFETWLLDRVAAHARADGAPVVEVGSGPGHVVAHLVSAGATATGLDLSPGMVEQARARFPQATYDVGDLRRLMRPASHDGWSAVLAWYSLIHLAPSELAAVIDALVRPLRPGGWLVLALHAGSGVRRAQTWFEEAVDLDVVLHEPAEVVALVEGAGLESVEWYRRGPVAALDEHRERLYVLARRPTATT